ncbi:conserved hypothetical protein [Rubrivivax sp. A210]|uniref:DUF3306 domain-containing protein n=1 Tax=Rubrivivax sp. A210 TaxID=2772301 RepID=UPI00191AE0B5|nr:DUF3306 domain-containing protein [Rubrivivax sp. A210]CAD5373803.1 conserved hypothetical protein [Rubrivivax sp. A210]
MSERGDDSFLSRWSRRKLLVRQGEAVAPAPVKAEVVAPVVDQPPAASAAGAPAVTATTEAEAPTRVPPPAQPPPPTLADVESLTPASDFARFVAPGVDAEVKNSAMKKLFADPHYNVMDGLDTYIDDYGRADPIPRSMLRQMVQARLMGLLDDELEEQRPAEEPAPVAPIALPAAETVELAPMQPAAPTDASTGAEASLAAPPAQAGIPPDAGAAADGAEPGPSRGA